MQPGDLAGVPTSIVRLDPRTHIPYALQYSIGVERQVTAKTTLSAVYIGNRGMDVFRSIDANAPLPGSVVRPNPTVGQLREMQPDGYLKGNALEAIKFFTLGVALSVYSGTPVNITTGGDGNHDGILNDRPARAARNIMPGPGMVDLDLNLSHHFPLSKQRRRPESSCCH